jgi:MYXO-CTERM domain-containing protein
MRGFAAFVVVWGLPAVAFAEQYEVSPGEDIEAAIAALQPGDELIVHGGDYVFTDRFSMALVGTEDAPILIRAADGEVPHLSRGDASQNLVDIDNAEYVEIRGIEFSGGSAGIRISGANHLTIRDCEIHSTEDVALRANDGGVVYQSLHIVHNNIHDTNNTGEGMYLGCNENGCQVADSVIENNWVHHTNQETVEQGDGIELKEGSYGNIIRNNVIHDTNYPCILAYSTVGNGAPNIIEGNVMWNCGDHGMQVAADAVIRNNIVLSVVSDGIAMQPHQSGAPANLEVVHNTVLIPSGNAISVSGATGSILLANNAVYTMSGNAITVSGDTSMTTIAGNVGMGGLSGGGGGYVDGDPTVDFIDGSFAGAPPIDPFPATGGALVGAGDPAYATEIDFNGLPHADPPDVGAYAYDPEGNPGWEIQAGFKDAPADPPGGTGSGGEESGSSSDGDDETGGSGTSGVSATEGGPGSAEGGPGSAEGGPDTATATDGADTASNDDDEGGCGCRSDGAPPPVGLLWLGMIPLLRRRRARKR